MFMTPSEDHYLDNLVPSNFDKFQVKMESTNGTVFYTGKNDEHSKHYILIIKGIFEGNETNAMAY